MKTVIPDNIDFSSVQLQLLKEMGVVIYSDMPKGPAELIERIQDAEVITANYVDVSPSVIDSCSKLKYIIAPAVGYDWIDASYAATKGITVVNCPSFNSQSVAEYAFALILATSRKIVQARESLVNGRWDPLPFTGNELAGKNIGLVGHGNIGKRIEKIAGGFEMIVSFIDSKSSQSDLDKLVSASDYLVLCVQLNSQTKHLLNARRLGLMKKESYLINISRGVVIDQPALAEALKNENFQAVGIDVFEDEPLIGVPTEAIAEIVKISKVLATPHIASNTYEAHKKLGDEIILNIKAILNDSPINIVNAG
jgi:phosphoglycerate dehydrogenase-like enzyme